LATIKQLNDHVEQENLYLRKEVLLKHTHEGILGESSAIHKVKAAIEQVAVSNATVLITGETGTGKELVSHAIHQYSQRKNSSMINLNCAALPATLLEAELFGREKGAYTGALTRQAGRFELANGGTLFLDEIGELPLELQSKLLRVLESGEFERLGGYQARKTDARIIAATNKDLAREVARGRFREDLFYRLNVFPIHVPPLRERTMDIPMLVWHFNQVLSRGMGKSISNISQKDMEKLKEYRWPGNVRELKNVIERALIVCRHGKLHIELGTATAALSDDALTLDEVNQKHIIRILERTGWKIRGKYGAAKLLAINPQTLDSRMKKLGIKRPAQNPAIS
jgi:transcriptional regulator with GAF, ATPase, and Fis domain